MSKYIICKATENHTHSFYLVNDSIQYHLFEQSYCRINAAYYGRGINLNDAVDYSKARGIATRKTMERLRKSLSKLEKEAGIAIWNKTIRVNRNGRKVKRSSLVYLAKQKCMAMQRCEQEPAA